MPDFWFFLTSTALFDSLSTAIQILIFVFLFSTPKPLANALSFLAGTCFAYLACGLIFLGHMDAINAFLAQFVPNVDKLSDKQYYLFELVAGLGFAAWGIWLFATVKTRKPSAYLGRFLGILKVLNPVTAALLGIFLSVTGFPASIPYLGALEKLAKAYGYAGAIPGALYYNLIYAVPMLVPLAVFLALRNHVADLEAKLHLHSVKWGNLVNYGLTVLMGTLFAVDGTVYFLIGHPMLSSKFF